MGLFVALVGCDKKEDKPLTPEKTSEPITRSAEMKTTTTPAGNVAP